MRSLAVSFVLGLLCVQNALCHSWIACAKYATGDGEYWDETKCSGYPRNWNDFKGSGFGVDTGYNYQVAGDVACRTPMTNPVSAAYSAQFPMARYAPGDRVCLVWPSKNHVAATCTNPYIPEGSLKVMLSPLNPTSDPPMSVFRNNVIADIGGHVNGVIDFKGYQHCPKFCENMDKSFCSQCFNLPTNLAAGRYVLLWYWVFNPDTTPYTSCMDIEISGSSSAASSASSSSSAASTTASATTASATTASATTASATTASATTAGPATTAAAATTTGPAVTSSTATTAAASTSASSTTASSTSGSTTGSGSALVVYDESLGSQFTTGWSWQVAVSYTSATYYSGMMAMQATMQPWGGLQIGAASSGIQWQGKYSALSFAVKCDQPNYSSVSVYFNQANKVRLSLSTNWQVFNLPLAATLNAPSSIFNPLGLVFFNEGPTPVNVYLDAVKLVP